MTIRDPAWRQTEPEDWDWYLESWENSPDDWVQAKPEDIDFPEPEPDDFDRRVDDMYSDRTELPDGDEPPF